MSIADFHEVRFPLALGLGASGGAEWRTEIAALASGAEVRNARWAGSRRRWDVATAVSSLADLNRLAAFFEARRGRLHGFRFRDPADWSSAGAGGDAGPGDQVIATGDGETATFQLHKAYGEVSRTIRKPVEGSVRVALDGVEVEEGWTVDTATGLVVFGTPPGVGVSVTAGFRFDCPVRFDADRLDISVEMIGAGRAVSVPIIELV